MMWGYEGFGGGGMIVMMLLGFLFLLGLAAVVGLGVWALVRAQRRGSTLAPGATPRALDLLQERYARGEITREEYQRMKEDLTT